MKTTDKVYVGESTTGTTSTTASQWQTYKPSKAEQGWECPRCGRINAPWVRQCDCSNNWTITFDSNKLDYSNPWWKDYVTCNQADNVINSNSVTYSYNTNTDFPNNVCKNH